VNLSPAAGGAGVFVRLGIWPDMIHVWHSFVDRLAPAREAIAVATQWMAERLRAPA